MSAIRPDFALRPAGTISGGGGGSGGSVPVGSIIEISTVEAIPAGFLPCYGQAVSRTLYSSLFAEVNTLYGAGDGTTTFNLPLKEMNVVGSTAMSSNAGAHARSVALADGRVLAIGSTSCYLGAFGGGNVITWTACTAYPVANWNFGVPVLLSDGRVLVIGGDTGTTRIANCYIATISGNTVTWVASTNYPITIRLFALTLLLDGRVLGVAGSSSSNVANTYFGTISGNTITWVAGTAYPAALSESSVVTLPSGKVFGFGGATGGSGGLTNAYIGTISGNTISWLTSNVLALPKTAFTSGLLPNGEVISFGGGGVSYANDVRNAIIRVSPLGIRNREVLPYDYATTYNFRPYTNGRLLDTFNTPNRSLIFSHYIIKT